MNVEEQLRATLQEHAGATHPDAQAWARLEAELDGARPRAGARWVRPIVALAAVTAILVVAAAVVFNRSGTDHVRTAAPPSPVHLLPASLPAGLHLDSIRDQTAPPSGAPAITVYARVRGGVPTAMVAVHAGSLSTQGFDGHPVTFGNHHGTLSTVGNTECSSSSSSKGVTTQETCRVIGPRSRLLSIDGSHVQVVAWGISDASLLRVAAGLQGESPTWLPSGFTQVFKGTSAPMQPGWNVSSVQYAGPGGRTASVGTISGPGANLAGEVWHFGPPVAHPVGGHPGALVDDGTGSPTLVFERDGAVVIINGTNLTTADLDAIASSLHPADDATWSALKAQTSHATTPSRAPAPAASTTTVP
jgi:hypothetical protein